MQEAAAEARSSYRETSFSITFLAARDENASVPHSSSLGLISRFGM